MNKVSRWATFDGKDFFSRKDAKKHLDKIYTDILLKLAHNLAGKKFSAIPEYIDENLNLFVKLKQIKDDMNVTETYLD